MHVLDKLCSLCSRGEGGEKVGERKGSSVVPRCVSVLLRGLWSIVAVASYMKVLEGSLVLPGKHS